MADVCDHDVTDREVAAVADGLCPLCLHSMTMRQSMAIQNLRAALKEVLQFAEDFEVHRKWVSHARIALNQSV